MQRATWRSQQACSVPLDEINKHAARYLTKPTSMQHATWWSKQACSTLLYGANKHAARYLTEPTSMQHATWWSKQACSTLLDGANKHTARYLTERASMQRDTWRSGSSFLPWMIIAKTKTVGVPVSTANNKPFHVQIMYVQRWIFHQFLHQVLIVFTSVHWR